MSGPAEPLVVGTAGHIDHGKTALVLALTGRDTDRLAAEKERGISIELGFAPLDLPSGRRLSLVDVPGHERFVRHMVAGASGVDGFLLCVAADDGVMPQTFEHLAVLELLDVHDGVVAITRSDLAGPEPAAAEAAELVGEGVEIVPVCAPSGAGVPELRAALDRLAARLRPRQDRGRPRLFVDRVFSRPGAGTVVTGTLWDGELTVEERVLVHPGGHPGRIRAIQVHDAPVERARGGRVALALAGIAREQAPRGSCVVREADGWIPVDRLGVRLRWLADAGRRFSPGERLQCFLGTAEVPARCIPLEEGPVPAGSETWAQLRLERPLPARAGDRVVLRSAERRTVGGGEVVDAAPPRGARHRALVERLETLAAGDPAERLRLRLRDAGALGVALAEADGAPPEAIALGGRLFDPDAVARAREAVTAAVSAGGVPVAAARAASGLPAAAAAQLLEALRAEGAIELRGQRAFPAGAESSLDPALEAMAAELEAAGLRPPTLHQLGERTGLAPERVRAGLGRLREAGRAEPAGELWFAPAALDQARRAAEQALAKGPLGIAELRDLWGVGRKHALAIAAYLDASGVTVRQGDLRALRGRVRAP